MVKLGQSVPVDFIIKAQAAELAAVTVSATKGAIISPNKTGVSTTIGDTAIARLPSLNRDFTDFARITPQVSTNGNGLSGGGVNNRYNLIQIDGANESDLFGLGSTGQPGQQAGAKAISLDAVKEYQVLLSPFDVRQGNFAGLLINAVTKSGTNEWHGSVFGYTRDQDLTRKQSYLGPYSRQQYGASLGGPIVRNKAFFFLATEWQGEELLSTGPYVGSSDSPVSQAQVDAFNAALAPYGIEGGSGARINRPNPLTNVFARVDLNFIKNTRVVLRHNYALADNNNFFRDPITSSQPQFPLTSYAYAFTSKKNATVLQAFTTLGSGVVNELNIGYTTINDKRDPAAKDPSISVVVPRSTGSGTALFQAGGEASSHGNQLDQKILEISDNLTVPLGDHNVTIGTKNIIYESANLFANNLFGTWRFNSLDSLSGTCATCAGIARASSYSVTVPTPAGTDGFIRMQTATYAFYAQDQWNLRPNLNLTFGIRADIPVFRNKPVYNKSVDSVFKRNTSEMPTGNIQWSPRIGFNWDITGDQKNQLRGGFGSFTGNPAGVWLSNMYGNTGLLGTPGLTCNNATVTNAFYPPAFNQAAVDNPPTRCGGTNANPGSAALSSTINSVDPDMSSRSSTSTRWASTTTSAATSSARSRACTRSRSTRCSTATWRWTARRVSMRAAARCTAPSPARTRARPHAGTQPGVRRVQQQRQGLLVQPHGQPEQAVRRTLGRQRSPTRTRRRRTCRARSARRPARTSTRAARSPATCWTRRPWRRPSGTCRTSIVRGGHVQLPVEHGRVGGLHGQLGLGVRLTTTAPTRTPTAPTANDLVYMPKNTTDANEILFTGYNSRRRRHANVAAQQDGDGEVHQRR